MLEAGSVCTGNIKDEVASVSEYQDSSCSTKTIIIQNSLLKDFGINLGDDKFNAKIQKISPTQAAILKELESMQIYNAKLKEIFLEAKILEMIYKSFEPLCENLHKGESVSFSCNSKLKFDDDELKTAMRAKKILLENLQNPPSIKRLARLCATNEFKLKSCFKHYLGATIYGFLQNERLSVAKGLLQSGDISVKEAAQLVGYSSFGHFSKIFKERFGVLPRTFSKGKVCVLSDLRAI